MNIFKFLNKYSLFKFVRTNPGFTLVELMVVVSILGLLAAIIFSSFNSARQHSRLTAGQQQMLSIQPIIGLCRNAGSLTAYNNNGTTDMCSPPVGTSWPTKLPDGWAGLSVSSGGTDAVSVGAFCRTAMCGGSGGVTGGYYIVCTMSTCQLSIVANPPF